ncbi:very long chain fatty acid elongase 4-like isoform X2 [Glandiceps talaboti]
MAGLLLPKMRELFVWADSVADDRTNEWPLVKSLYHPFMMTSLYLLVVWQGPRLMENRKPLSMRYTMVVYNAFLVCLSAFMFKEFVISSWPRKDFSWVCQSVDYSDNPLALRLAGACWWFYISKYIEFLDTFIFIARKKNEQISVLHVYHHSTMPLLWWLVTKWIAGGTAFFSAMANCLVHTIMYSYYSLSAIGPHMQPYLWWKKYLTKMQMVQFIIVACQTSLALYSRCGYHAFPLWLLFFYMISMFLLFANFYRVAYLKRRDTSKRTVTANSSNSTNHSTVHAEKRD